MAKIEFKGDLPLSKQENKINQGDYVYCKAVSSGALSFWGIFSETNGVIALDGAGNFYITKRDIYLGETYVYWTIIKRIPCDKVKLTIEEV